MTENEFLTEYISRYKMLIDTYVLEMESNMNLHYEKLSDKYIEFSYRLHSEGNTLISDIMYEFNLDYNHMVYEGLVKLPVSMVLFQRSFSIQTDYLKEFDNKSKAVLKDALCRDFPDHRHRQ